VKDRNIYNKGVIMDAKTEAKTEVKLDQMMLAIQRTAASGGNVIV
jgi:hypothetical protein